MHKRGATVNSGGHRHAKQHCLGCTLAKLVERQTGHRGKGPASTVSFAAFTRMCAADGRGWVGRGAWMQAAPLSVQRLPCVDPTVCRSIQRRESMCARVVLWGRRVLQSRARAHTSRYQPGRYRGNGCVCACFPQCGRRRAGSDGSDGAQV